MCVCVSVLKVNPKGNAFAIKTVLNVIEIMNYNCVYVYITCTN
jgi:hypothetical protein